MSSELKYSCNERVKNAGLIGAVVLITIAYLLVMEVLKNGDHKLALNMYTQNRIVASINKANLLFNNWDENQNPEIMATQINDLGESLRIVSDLYSIDKSHETNFDNFMSNYYYNLSNKFSDIQANDISRRTEEIKKMIKDIKNDLTVICNFNYRNLKAKGKEYKLLWEKEILHRLKINAYNLSVSNINKNLPQICYDDNTQFNNKGFNLKADYGWMCKNIRNKTVELTLEVYADGKLIKKFQKTKKIKDGNIRLNSRYPMVMEILSTAVEFRLEVDHDKDYCYIQGNDLGTNKDVIKIQDNDSININEVYYPQDVDFYKKSDWGAEYTRNAMILEKNRTYNLVTSYSIPNGYKVDSKLINEDLTKYQNELTKKYKYIYFLNLKLVD